MSVCTLNKGKKKRTIDGLFIAVVLRLYLNGPLSQPIIMMAQVPVGPSIKLHKETISN